MPWRGVDRPGHDDSAFVAPSRYRDPAYDAAHQSYLPRLVPTPLLTEANTRLAQTSSVAQTVGPMIAGWLVKAISAPVAILVDAVSYLMSGLVLTTLRTQQRAEPVESRNLRRELREGLSWVYRHRMLAPLAITSHAWLLFTGMVGTISTFFVLDGLGFDAFALGVTFALGGVGGVLGADRLQGRMNATIRSLNRGMVVIGAPLGGVLADELGNRPALWIAVTGLIGQAIVISCSQLRHARLPDTDAQFTT